MQDDPLSALKGIKSFKTYNFRIKVGNLQMAYCLYFVNIFIKLTFLSLLWQRCRFSANDSCNCVTLFLPLQLLIVDQWYLYTVTSNSDHISDKCVNCMECNNSSDVNLLLLFGVMFSDHSIMFSDHSIMLYWYNVM